MTKKTPEEIKDTQPYQVILEDNEVKPESKKKKPILKGLKALKDRQVEMFDKPKKQRLAVWTQNGSRKWNRLRHLLHQIVIESKTNGQSDVESFCSFADNPEVQILFKEHPNESIRDWSRDSINDSARIRMKQDLEALIKDKDAPTITKADDLPEHYPKSVLEKGKKRNPLLDYAVRAGAKL